MDPALAGLAGAAGAALVQAMATDFWGTTKSRLTRIIGRAAPAAEDELTRELEASAYRLARRPGPEATAAEQDRWTALLTTLLAEHAEVSAELHDFVAHVQRSLSDAATLTQNITVGRNAFIAGRDQHITMPPDDDVR